MPEDLAPEAAQASPEPEDSSTPALETTVAAQGPDSPPADATPKRDRRQERIAELVAERTAAKEYGEYMRREVVSLQEKLAGNQATVNIAQPNPQPTLEQFDHDTDKWAAAYSVWSDQRVQAVAKAQVGQAMREQDAANEAEASRARWQDKSSDFAEKHPDFETVISNPALKITPDMLSVFQDSDKGPEIAYHLGKNPDVAAKLARLPRNKMTLAICRLERDISTPKPQPTNAPEPPTPIGGQAPETDIGNMEINDWMAHEKARLREKRKLTHV